MTTPDLTLSAAAQGRAIDAGTLDPRDLTEAYLAAIDGHEFGDRIYARTTPDRARAEAALASERARLGLRRGPLDGVPISWKDLFDSAGVATESGSALLKDRVPAADAQVLANASAAGLVCLGKTHMTELAFSGLGLNPVTATPPCVHDPDAVPGGSSSGAGSSVAHGLAAAGIGSDTAGSVRIPAAWNNLAGLRTTPGRLSLDGVVPLCPKFDTAGPLCRTVEDCALTLAAMEGTKAPDLQGATLAGTRMLVLDGIAFDGIEDQPAAAFGGAVARLEAAGVRIDRAVSTLAADALDLAPVLFAPEAYGVWKERIEADPDLMFPPILERFRGGRDFGAADYVAGWRHLESLRARFAEETAGYDAVLLPTCAILPPKIADLMADPAYFTERNLMALRNTRIGNLLGLPSLTVPTGTPSSGLLLMTPAGTDGRLLRLGAAAEAALA